MAGAREEPYIVKAGAFGSLKNMGGSEGGTVKITEIAKKEGSDVTAGGSEPS